MASEVWAQILVQEKPKKVNVCPNLFIQTIKNFGASVPSESSPFLAPSQHIIVDLSVCFHSLTVLVAQEFTSIGKNLKLCD